MLNKDVMVVRLTCLMPLMPEGIHCSTLPVIVRRFESSIMKYQSFPFLVTWLEFYTVRKAKKKIKLSSTVIIINEACNQAGACTPIVT